MPATEWIRPRYPHMGPWEAEIWSDFLRKTDLKFIRIDYDVKVGPGNVPPGYEELAKLTGMDVLTKLRIDAVGETEDEIWIFEVKPRAGRSALGQLEAYAYWYYREKQPKKPIRLGVVCRDVDRNMLEVYRQHGVHVFLV